MPRTRDSAMEALHKRMCAWQHRLRVGMATQVLDLPFATYVLADDMPDVYDVNLVTVTRPVSADVLLRSIDKVAATAGWRHRRIGVDDERIAATLREPLLAAGYTEERFVTMALLEPYQPGTASDLPTDVVGVDDHAAFTRAVHAEQPWAHSDALLDQVAERERRLAAVADARVVVAPPDEPVSRCLLLTDGALFEIDAVDTLTRHRRQGWSNAIMRRAIAEATAAQAEQIMLIADDEDWPKHWYGRLGFRVVGRSAAFRRYPSERSDET